MGRTIGVLLALSLAANVFLGGFVAGRIASPGFSGFEHGPGPLGRKGPHGDFHREFEALPEAAREKLRAQFKENRAAFVETFREGRALQQEFISILTAETFDRAGAEAVAAKIEAFEAERRRSMPRLVIEVMDGLPVEDRRALAKVIERRIMEDMKGPGRRGHRGPPPEMAGPERE
jgi:Spy/CpxP family protein refolding chaperone